MISGASLSALVLADHVARYPESMAATRQNTLTGVALHRPVEELVRALCNGLASAMSQLRVADTVAGTANVPGASVPVPYSFTAIPQAKAAFLAASGWVGADASGGLRGDGRGRGRDAAATPRISAGRDPGGNLPSPGPQGAGGRAAVASTSTSAPSSTSARTPIRDMGG